MYIPKFLHRMVDRLQRCRPIIILINALILLWTFFEWLWFYIRFYYMKWSKPLWRV